MSQPDMVSAPLLPVLHPDFRCLKGVVNDNFVGIADAVKLNVRNQHILKYDARILNLRTARFT